MIFKWINMSQHILKHISRAALVGLCLVSLSGCDAFKGLLGASNNPYTSTNLNPDAMYRKAKGSFDGEQWKTAARQFEEIEQRYPYTIYAQQALIHIAYANWKQEQNDAAIKLLNQFIDIYPSSPYLDYALYLKGSIHINPESSFLSKMIGKSQRERDPKGLKMAYQSFDTLIKYFPKSRYARDASLRMRWIISTIAEHEIQVARYYLKRGAYVGAINRAQYVLTQFSGVPSHEKALYIMWQSYEGLGLSEKANNAKRVLDLNYPNSKLYKTGVDDDLTWYDYLSPDHWTKKKHPVIEPPALSTSESQ